MQKCRQPAGERRMGMLVRRLTPEMPGIKGQSLLERWQNFLALQNGQGLLWLPVAVGIGMVGELELAWVQERVWAAVALVTLALLALTLRRWGVAVAFILVLLGGGRMALREYQVAAPTLVQPHAADLRVRVESTTQVDDKRWLLVGQPLTIDGNPSPLHKIRLSLRGRIGAIRTGDLVRVHARLRRPPPPISPGGFDAQRRAWFDQIGAYGVVLGVPVREEARLVNGIVATMDRARGWLSARFRARISGNAGEVAVALITGDQDGLDPATARDVRAASLPHLLTVSGFHLAIVSGFAFWGIRRMLALVPPLALRWPVKSLAAVAAGLVAIAYTIFTGAAYPTVRSCLGCLLVLLAIAVGRRPFSLRLLAVAALLILLAKPESIINISFQLSFAAITGLFLVVDSRWMRILNEKGEGLAWWERAGRAVLAGALTSVGTEAAIAPIAIAHFNQIGLYGLFANALAVPLTTFMLMPLGLLTAVLAPLQLEGLVTPLLGFGCEIFLWIARGVGRFPAALVHFPNIGTLALGLALLSGIWLANILGPARRWAMIFLCAAAGAALLEPLPDVRIAPDANVIAIRGYDGTLIVSDERRGRYIRDSWSEDSGTVAQWPWSAGGAGYGLDPAPTGCAGQGCRAELQRGARLWRIVYLGRTAEATACPAADILIDGRLRRERRCHQGIVIDRRWLLANGATEIYATSHALRLRTDRDVRGDHLWTPYR